MRATNTNVLDSFNMGCRHECCSGCGRVSAIVSLCAVRVTSSRLAHLVFQKSEDAYIIPQLIMFAHISFQFVLILGVILTFYGSFRIMTLRTCL